MVGADVDRVTLGGELLDEHGVTEGVHAAPECGNRPAVVPCGHESSLVPTLDFAQEDGLFPLISDFR